MQLLGNGESTTVKFRDRQLNPNPKSVSCYKLPPWLVRSLEALLHTMPNVTAIRLTLMSDYNEIGHLHYDLNGHSSSNADLSTD